MGAIADLINGLYVLMFRLSTSIYKTGSSFDLSFVLTSILPSTAVTCVSAWAIADV
jgi:hypothetical protein